MENKHPKTGKPSAGEERGFNRDDAGRNDDKPFAEFAKDKRKRITRIEKTEPRRKDDGAGDSPGRADFNRDDAPRREYEPRGEKPERRDEQSRKPFSGSGERRSYNPNFTKDNKFRGDKYSGRDDRGNRYDRDPDDRGNRYDRNPDDRPQRDYNRSGDYNRPDYNRSGDNKRQNESRRGESRQRDFGRSDDRPQRDYNRSDDRRDYNRGPEDRPQRDYNRSGDHNRPDYNRSGDYKRQNEPRGGEFRNDHNRTDRSGAPASRGRDNRDNRDNRDERGYRDYRGDKPSPRGGGEGRATKYNPAGGKPRYDKPQGDRRSAGKMPKTEVQGRYKDGSYPTFPAPVIEDEIRLNRYIAAAGKSSRREADDLIREGRVTVNGLTVTEMGSKIKAGDIVQVDGETIRSEKKVYILMNKPKGFVTTLEDPFAEKTVMDLLRNACSERVYPVGRLDKNSLGVLLVTNDGDLTTHLTHPSFNKKKIYQVTLDKQLTRADMQQIIDGIVLEDGEIHADEVDYVDDTKKEIGIEIHSGRNRVVRRIFEHLGYRVTKLDRVYFAGLTKKNLKRGQWRFLSPKEVDLLKSGRYE